MSESTYTEPQVSFLVLDFQRQASAAACLRSIRHHVKLPLSSYRVIYCHNGLADYPHLFLKAGLIDELIMPRVNGGLGLGTRALYAACFSPLAISWQCDQLMGRDFTQEEVDALMVALSPAGRDEAGRTKLSIGLAGPVCGRNVYSERALATLSESYRWMEHNLPLTHGGAGPHAHVMWREEQLQKHYAERGYVHDTDWPPLAIDNGRDAVRQNPDGSIWRHFPDTKALHLVSGPVKERYVYPKLSEREWQFVLEKQSWPDGQIPENEVKDSFHVWN